MKIRLRKNYDYDYCQFLDYDRIYGISKRLGFDNPESAWEENPKIEVTTNPNDLKVIK